MWSAEAAETLRLWWEARIARQQEIDDSIAAKADYDYLYDKPYEDKRKVRVAGPFTVESLSPHRVLAVDENDELLDRVAEAKADFGPRHQDFAGMILEQLATAGVQQAHKEDRIAFASRHAVARRVHLRRGALLRRRGSVDVRRSAPGSSSARSSARSPARTSWRRPARLATQTSTC